MIVSCGMLVDLLIFKIFYPARISSSMKKSKKSGFFFHPLIQFLHNVKTNRAAKKIIVLICFLPFLAGNWSCAAKKNIKEDKIVYEGNKIIPVTFFNEATLALSHYPELEDVKIEFKYKSNIKNAFMQAQPKFSNIFKRKKDRGYYVFISTKFLIEDEEFSMADVPSEVLIGWLGHELGHIIDYIDKSAIELVQFGTKYIVSERFIKKAERTADTNAINHGMGIYIFATKDFILNHSGLSDSYKKRKARLYLSPQEILVMVNGLDEELAVEFDEELEVELEEEPES